MKIYKAHLRTELKFIVLFIVLSFAVPMTSAFPNTVVSWTLYISLLLVFLLINLLDSRLNEIHLDTLNQSLTFIHKNYFGTKKVFVCNLQNLEFTYKQEATSIRSGIKNICSIYHFGKIIEKLIPDNDGWNDDDINEFVHDLVRNQIKKKDVGYTLKDVEL